MDDYPLKYPDCWNCGRMMIRPRDGKGMFRPSYYWCYLCEVGAPAAPETDMLNEFFKTLTANGLLSQVSERQTDDDSGQAQTGSGSRA